MEEKYKTNYSSKELDSLWDYITGLGDRIVVIICYISLIIQICKTERDINIILIIGIFLICAKLDLLRLEK